MLVNSGCAFWAVFEELQGILASADVMSKFVVHISTRAKSSGSCTEFWEYSRMVGSSGSWHFCGMPEAGSLNVDGNWSKNWCTDSNTSAHDGCTSGNGSRNLETNKSHTDRRNFCLCVATSILFLHIRQWVLLVVVRLCDWKLLGNSRIQSETISYDHKRGRTWYNCPDSEIYQTIILLKQVLPWRKSTYIKFAICVVRGCFLPYSGAL